MRQNPQGTSGQARPGAAGPWGGRPARGRRESHRQAASLSDHRGRSGTAPGALPEADAKTFWEYRYPRAARIKKTARGLKRLPVAFKPAW